MNKRGKSRVSVPSVDGISGDPAISNHFASKLHDILNSHDSSSVESILNSVSSSLSSDDLASVEFSSECVFAALRHLKPSKSDGSALQSDHVIHAASVIVPLLSDLFTAIVHHGYMPEPLCDCILVPIPKGQKDPSISDNYRPIALAPTISKPLEWCILTQYSSSLMTCGLQFGFRQGLSTTIATGLIKNVTSRYLHRGSNVFGCFLDASKAFDLVNHSILFKKLLERNLPLPIVRLLLVWYMDQRMQVRWQGSLSHRFSVSNGVRQGGVLSPVLFTVYLDDLLIGLERLGVGCHWKSIFAGAVCYADDLTLLAPSPAALRLMLKFCEDFASSHGLKFNASKTQLIRFGNKKSSSCSDVFSFCGAPLPLLDSVTHLGHVLRFDLDDGEDIIRASREMVRKANCMLRSFAGCDPIVKTKLFRAFCLSLYGSALWNISSSSLNSIEVAFNNILRRIWSVPQRTHTGILHCLAGLPSVYNTVLSRSKSLIYAACSSSSFPASSIFRDAGSLAYTFSGFNKCFGARFGKTYDPQDRLCADVIRGYRLSFGQSSPFEEVISIIACS